MMIVRYITLAALLYSCSAIPKKNLSTTLPSSYIFIDKKNNFYDELTLRLEKNGIFYLKQRVGPETFEVKGNFNLVRKDVISLAVIDTTTLLRKEPVYNFYNTNDTAIFLNQNKIKLNGRNFKRINQ